MLALGFPSRTDSNLCMANCYLVGIWRLKPLFFQAERVA